MSNVFSLNKYLDFSKLSDITANEVGDSESILVDFELQKNYSEYCNNLLTKHVVLNTIKKVYQLIKSTNLLCTNNKILLNKKKHSIYLKIGKILVEKYNI
jgi:hypothetical protein